MPVKEKSKLKSQIVKLLNESNIKEAAQLGRIFCEEYPDDPESYLLLGVALLNAEKYDKSRRTLLRGLQTFPNDWQLHEILGHVYGHLNRFREAEIEYSAAIACYGSADREEKALLHYQLANALWVQSERDSAVEQWKHALKINPGCTEAKEALEEYINEYGEPKAPNPVFDDLYHFEGIHLKRYFALVGREEFSTKEETKNVMDIIMNGWNEYVSPRSKDNDDMTITERSAFFKNITLNFTDAVMKWRGEK